MFKRILIANRGEIAVRVLRACRKLGVEAVAVYSDADAQALHVRLADEAVRLGPAPSSESYLDQQKVIDAALATGAQAIHPGYGFLAENAGFARRVQKAGLTWIGPAPEAMDKMGDKVSARASAQKAGVPVAPGSGTLKDAAEARKEAKRVGLPIMLKAAAGGGGIGMRVVRDAKDVEREFLACQAQAKAAFGDDSVFMERFVERPRHIEVQVLGDHHGNVIHLFERECSIQRRHQKLVEEAPSPALSQQQREEIGLKAVKLAKLVGYTNAGTLEFLYEEEPAGGGSSTRHRGGGSEPAAGGGRFFFNEMNTRLQVEHPVTEMVTGIDLVEWQLRIAADQELTVKQEDIRLTGHAIEARINAEDPMHDFRPSPGPVRGLQLANGTGVRCDTGLYPGWTVPSAYDSLVLKLITHAGDRDGAVARMQEALAALRIDGFTTNQDFHRRLMAHPAFRAGDMSTRFLEEHRIMDAAPEELARVAAIVAALHERPGGGLAGMRLDQRLPARRASPGRRDWRAQ